LGDSGTDGIIILKLILNKYGVWTETTCLRTGSIASSSEHNTELFLCMYRAFCYLHF